MNIYDLPIVPAGWQWLPDGVEVRTDGKILVLCKGEGDKLVHVAMTAGCSEEDVRAAVAFLERAWVYESPAKQFARTNARVKALGGKGW